MGKDVNRPNNRPKAAEPQQEVTHSVGCILKCGRVVELHLKLGPHYS